MFKTDMDMKSEIDSITESNENQILRILEPGDTITFAYNCGRVLALDVTGINFFVIY